MPSSGSLHGPVVLLLGPHLGAISGVSAHLKAMLRSRLGEDFVLDQFPVGSEGRDEGRFGRWLRLAGSVVSLAAVLHRRKPQLLHINTSLNAGAFWRDLIYLLLARLHGVQVVYQVHGGKLPQDFVGPGRTLRSLLRRLLMLPDVVVVLAEMELRAYRSFVPEQRVVLIPNAVDSLALASTRQRRQGAQGPLRLVYLGRLAREKGLYELLEAHATILAGGVEAHLTFVGAGGEEAGLRAAVERLDTGAHVHFAGAAFGDAKAALLGQSDAFVLPSYAEGLPCALLEAMAAGNAVIATRVGAIPDVVIPGLHGILVAPRDVPALSNAIAALAADRPAVARMQVAAASHIAAGYSLERFRASFSDLYNSMLAGRQPAAHQHDIREGTTTVQQAAKCAE
ncbi:MAG TPA: glycosyltransferase family 4 protein [Steroidobacteraceae bacterium]|nr:glycosyltransferase family 4 protein [Steroidobacteraceae bacterium]